MCSVELSEWLGLIVFESNRCLKDVLTDLRSMTPAERQELMEVQSAHWPPFDLASIENELASIVEEHGDAVAMGDPPVFERAAA